MDGAFISLNRWGVYDLMGGAYVTEWMEHYGLMGGALWPKWVVQLLRSKLLFRLEICSKNAGLQGSSVQSSRVK